MENLARALGTYGAWVTEYLPQTQPAAGARVPARGTTGSQDYEQPVDGTPCQVVIESRRLVHYPDRILELYPDEPELRSASARSATWASR